MGILRLKVIFQASNFLTEPESSAGSKTMGGIGRSGNYFIVEVILVEVAGRSHSE